MFVLAAAVATIGSVGAMFRKYEFVVDVATTLMKEGHYEGRSICVLC